MRSLLILILLIPAPALALDINGGTVRSCIIEEAVTISGATMENCTVYGVSITVDGDSSLSNVIGRNIGNTDITVDAGITATAINNCFENANATGAGTYSDTSTGSTQDIGVALDENITIGEYVWEVTADGFGADDYLKVDDEICSIMSVSSHTLIISARGLFGTTEATHAIGTIIYKYTIVPTTLWSTDPLFFDPAGHDYRLRKKSPCAWSGTTE